MFSEGFSDSSVKLLPPAKKPVRRNSALHLAGSFLNLHSQKNNDDDDVKSLKSVGNIRKMPSERRKTSILPVPGLSKHSITDGAQPHLSMFLTVMRKESSDLPFRKMKSVTSEHMVNITTE